MTASQLQFLEARVDSASDRLNRILDERARREAEALARETREQERAATRRALAHAEEKRQIQSQYNDSFLALGSQCPAPADDMPPGRFRRMLYDTLRRKLAPDHPLATVRSDELSSSPEILSAFENRLFEAVKVEAVSPSWSNLPAEGMIERHVTDPATGSRETRFFGRKSYIADMNRPGRKVARIVHTPTMSVLWGRPFDQAR